MKRILLAFLIMFSFSIVSAQHSQLSDISVVLDEGNWVKMRPESRVELNHFFDLFHSEMELNDNYSFQLIDKTSDVLGYTHYRYQEYFKGHPIEGAVYLLHEKNGFISHANGKLIKGIGENMSPSLSEELGLQIAKGQLNSERYYWELPGMESLIKRLKKDPNATFYPNAELVYAQEQFSGDGEKYRLAWKYDLYGYQPIEKKTVFVDAANGNVLFSIEGCHENAVEGVAETRYHGTQTMMTDSISASEYRLIDSSRADGVETYDMNENVDDYSLAVDFIDDDNYWDNANEEMDDAATDAHWGTGMFYDYFLQTHGRNSFDDDGGVMINYVHYDEDYSNAFSNGLFITYGDGNENPYTYIDVVAHEFTHLLTTHSAALIYMNESGALNESFSDIFGTAVEFYALGDEASWLVGTANYLLRNMADPNQYNQPDTYLGDLWYSGFGDNGGVHYNSGVQNFWFYLLSEGGTGINDNGDAYDIDSLGMEVAAAIAYRNLTVYLTPGATYLDARYGAIQAAEDLYGVCSDVALEVIEAWHAVGVGTEMITPDIEIVNVTLPSASSCEFSSQEQIAMDIRLIPTGCNQMLEVGDEITVSYQINSESPVFETFELTESLNSGETITYEFQTLADLSEQGLYDIDYSIALEGDLNAANDEILDYRLTNAQILEGNNMITFDGTNAAFAYYPELGDNAIVGIVNFSGVSFSNALRLRSFGASPENVTIVDDENENFEVNADFVSKVNVCVDLSGWNEAFLNFDLRQTYSPYYLNELGVDLSDAISLRVTVDGTQIGEQYHPETNSQDQYETRILDFSEYAGSSFVVTFEGIHFVYDDEVPGGIGDKSFLENIFFSEANPMSIESLDQVMIDIFPNPSSGLFNIEMKESGNYNLRVSDLSGKVLQEQNVASNGSTFTLNLSEFSKGVYLISIQTDRGQVVKKIVLE